MRIGFLSERIVTFVATSLPAYSGTLEPSPAKADGMPTSPMSSVPADLIFTDGAHGVAVGQVCASSEGRASSAAFVAGTAAGH